MLCNRKYQIVRFYSFILVIVIFIHLFLCSYYKFSEQFLKLSVHLLKDNSGLFFLSALVPSISYLVSAYSISLIYNAYLTGVQIELSACCRISRKYLKPLKVLIRCGKSVHVMVIFLYTTYYILKTSIFNWGESEIKCRL